MCNSDAVLIMTSSCTSQDLVIQCYGRVDSHRYMVGDTTGKLFMLYLQCDEKMGDFPIEIVTDLKLQLLGEVQGYV